MKLPVHLPRHRSAMLIGALCCLSFVAGASLGQGLQPRIPRQPLPPGSLPCPPPCPGRNVPPNSCYYLACNQNSSNSNTSVCYITTDLNFFQRLLIGC